ncbi:hypothetical protein B566_EDAN008876 [Ephemera danica]|nr:hypothetical protein B566_EDAN008876 [Ephemera danica]
MEVETISEDWAPKDGGWMAWSVLFAACITNGVVLGFWNDNSVIYAALLTHNADSGETNLAFKASLVMSLCAGMIFMMAPFGGILIDLKGYRCTAFLGATVAALALLASSWLLHSIPALCVTFLIFGAGTSLIQLSSIAILGLHFRKRLGLMNGFVASSSSVFGTIFPQCMKQLLFHYGLPGLLRVFTALFMFVAILAASAYLLKYALIKFPGDDNYILSMSLNIPGMISRLAFGAFSDLKTVNRRLLQQVAFLSMGLFTALIPVVDSWSLAVVITLGIGMMSGGAWSLLGPVGTELCGVAGAPQALGFMFGIGSIPLIVGTSIAGLLYDYTDSYQLSFYLAGASILVGSTLMHVMRFVT